MSLKQWATNGWLKPHKTNRKQILDLWAIVERDIEDAAEDVSADWKFGIAYNAVLKLCTILLYAEGYRTESNLAHYRTLQAMPLILGKEAQADADYLDACRMKRNTAEYDAAGRVSKEEAKELIAFAKELKTTVSKWLETHHKNLAV